MQFLPPRSRNSLTNPIVGILLHALALAGLVFGAFKALEASSWLPLIAAVALLAALEGLWLYLTLRR